MPLRRTAPQPGAAVNIEASYGFSRSFRTHWWSRCEFLLGYGWDASSGVPVRLHIAFEDTVNPRLVSLA